MGICYSEESEWEVVETNYRTRRKNKKKDNFNSIIYEEKTFDEKTFVPKIVDDSIRRDIHATLNELNSQNGSVAFGSIVELQES
jgi:hypothetical protein